MMTTKMKMWNRLNEKLHESRNPEVWIKEFNLIVDDIIQERDEAILEILKDSLGYHCDKPDCDHNLKEAIKVLESKK